MATIKDVAREVGLSITTVSRALNNHDDVAPATRERIQAVARRLEYHPNAVARSLQGSRANAVGVVIPRALHRDYDLFWLEFIGGCATACAEARVDLLLSAAGEGDRVTEGFARLVRGRRVDGLLVCDVRTIDPRIGYLFKHKVPFVAFGRSTAEREYSYIDVDGATGTARAIEHLAYLGHRRLAYLGVDASFGFAQHRLQGYRHALTRMDLEDNPTLVVEGLTEVTAEPAARRLLSQPRPPTAIFAGADFLALAVLVAARALGLRVPGDVSLVVFDDNPLVQHTVPPLTAVSQPNRDLGRQATQLLLERLAHPDAPHIQRLVQPDLVVRESTAPVNLHRSLAPTA